MVYVRLEDRNTGVGAAVIVSAKSASVTDSTSTLVMVVLLLGTGSIVCDVIVAEFRMVVPSAVPLFTLSTKTIGSPVALAPPANAGAYVQMIGPVPPAPGFVQVQFASTVML